MRRNFLKNPGIYTITVSMFLTSSFMQVSAETVDPGLAQTTGPTTTIEQTQTQPPRREVTELIMDEGGRAIGRINRILGPNDEELEYYEYRFVSGGGLGPGGTPVLVRRKLPTAGGGLSDTEITLGPGPNGRLGPVSSTVRRYGPLREGGDRLQTEEIEYQFDPLTRRWQPQTRKVWLPDGTMNQYTWQNGRWVLIQN